MGSGVFQKRFDWVRQAEGEGQRRAGARRESVVQESSTRTLPLPLLAAFFLPAVQAALLAIDYGAEFTKISLVKPGVPIDVVLNKDSKRKVQSVVGWKKDERLFGSEAAAVVRLSLS